MTNLLRSCQSPSLITLPGSILTRTRLLCYFAESQSAPPILGRPLIEHKCIIFDGFLVGLLFGLPVGRRFAKMEPCLRDGVKGNRQITSTYCFLCAECFAVLEGMLLSFKLKGWRFEREGW